MPAVAVGCAFAVDAVTDAALTVGGLAMEDAVTKQKLFAGVAGRHRQGGERWARLRSEQAELRSHQFEIIRLCRRGQSQQRRNRGREDSNLSGHGASLMNQGHAGVFHIEMDRDS